MNLYGLFILDVNIKYIVFSILYRHINVPMACKELKWEVELQNCMYGQCVAYVCRLVPRLLCVLGGLESGVRIFSHDLTYLIAHG